LNKGDLYVSYCVKVKFQPRRELTTFLSVEDIDAVANVLDSAASAAVLDSAAAASAAVLDSGTAEDPPLACAVVELTPSSSVIFPFLSIVQLLHTSVGW
jgi:hypothetical protein